MASKRDKYTNSAKGRECQIRLRGVCSHDPETTVPAHLPGAGWALKMPNILIAYSCDRCHDAVDGRIKTGYTKDELRLAHYEGVVRTQLIMIREGILIL